MRSRKSGRVHHEGSPESRAAFRARRLLRLLAWAVILTCLLFALLLVLPRSKTFSLHAQTEIVNIDIHDTSGTSTWLPAAEISVAGRSAGAPIEHAVRLDLEDAVHLSMARTGLGDILIQLDWAPPSRGARLSEGAPLEPGTVIRVPLAGLGADRSRRDASMLSAFRGVLRVGDDVGPKVQRTLLSGTVTIVEKDPIGHDRYVVGTAPLEAGDVVSWQGKHGSKTDENVIVSGFVHAGSTEGLTVVAHGDADHLLVERFGAVGYEVASPWLDRLTHEPWLSNTGLLLVTLSAALSIIVALKEVLLPREMSESGSLAKARVRRDSGQGARGILILFAASIFTAVLCAHWAVAQEVAYLNSLPNKEARVATTQGNAWLFSRGGQCFAVTPRHVLIDEQGIRDDRYARVVIARPGEAPIEAGADRCAVFKKYDLAVMRVSGVERMADCGRVLSGLADEGTLLGRSREAALITAASSGRFERSNLGIRQVTSDPDYFRVAVTSDRDRLTEGMSGGLVTIQDQLAGFLVTVGNDSETEDTGKVLRADKVSILLTRLLDGGLGTADVEGTCATRSVTLPSLTRTQNLASAACGAAVTRWSAPPLSEVNRPEALIGAAGPNALWRVAANSEVSVEIRLCGKVVPNVNSVSLDVSGCDASENQNVDLEVMSLANPGESFQSLGYGALPHMGIVTIETGTPHPSRELMLRFVPGRHIVGTFCAQSLVVN